MEMRNGRLNILRSNVFFLILVWNMDGANVLLIILFVTEKLFFLNCFEL